MYGFLPLKPISDYIQTLGTSTSLFANKSPPFTTLRVYLLLPSILRADRYM